MFKIRHNPRFAAAVAALTLATSVAVAAPSVGLRVNDSPQPGYTLVAPTRSTETYLVDTDGLLVRKWTSAYVAGVMAYMLDNGDMVRSAKIPVLPPEFSGAVGAGGRIEQVDWNNNLVWEFEYADGTHLPHHDIEPMPNGNLLMIVWDYVPAAEAIAEGRDPALVNTKLWIDSIIEVEPTPPSGGTIVWEWHVKDHLVQDFDPTKNNFGVVADHPELVDFNTGGPQADWTHFNGVAYNPVRDEIVVSVHTLHEIWVIDHSTTTAEAAGHTGGNRGRGGDILYRWGNPQIYDRGVVDDQILYGQHDPQWIPDGEPGAGNIIIFNNGRFRPEGAFSSVEEIAPPIDEDGDYVIEPGAPFGPASTVWTYTADPPTSLYSATQSGAQRQPNGNTLISLASGGRMVEVDQTGKVVWEYVNPLETEGPLEQGAEPTKNTIFKVRRYPPDFPGFDGLTLTPGDPIETFTPPVPPPDGTLRADRVADDGSTIDVTWDAFSCASIDFNLIYGDLAAVSSYAVDGSECGLGTSGGHLWSAVPDGDLFFLVVGTDGTGFYESSWGHDAAREERFGNTASFECGTTTKVVSSTCP